MIGQQQRLPVLTEQAAVAVAQSTALIQRTQAGVLPRLVARARQAVAQQHLRRQIRHQAAGADLIQLYTGFIYEGPGLIKEINKAILKRA